VRADEKLCANLWWKDNTMGIAIIGGVVSGGLECIDFDCGELFAPWCELVDAQVPGLVARLCIVRTPRDPAGYHVRYRCSAVPIPGNTRLAEKTGSDPKTGKPCRWVLIETRGEGGYALAPGSPPACHSTGRTYDHIAGPPVTELSDITASEREILIASARSFDLICAGKKTTPAGRTSGAGSRVRPGDDYDQRGPDWSEILEIHGWTCMLTRGKVQYWRRPGKTDGGWSATTGYCKAQNGADLLHVFSANGHPFEPGKSYGKFAAHALLNHQGDYKVAARELARKGFGPSQKNGDATHGTLNGVASPVGREPTGSGNLRPEILITTEEHEVNNQAVQALARDMSIYQRGGQLVRVVRDTSPAVRGIRRPLSPRIDPLPQALLRERLAEAARWIKLRQRGDTVLEEPGRPPAWCVAAVHARGNWPTVRHLEAVVEYPVLRPDGTVLDVTGYDPITGLLLEPTGPLPSIADRPSRADAEASRDELLDVVSDFPFMHSIHRSAWLAALLSPLARFAYAGPTPLFLCDSNVRGAGKGLLLDVISRIVTGERFTVATYTTDDNELRKRITSIVMEGDRLVLFDNLDGRFGGPVLDAALTATSWKDRLLGYNRMASAPMFMTWYATGNNVLVGADTSRRTCHIRLESDQERPEERTGFRRPNLLAWVGDHRQKLLAAGLTVLRGYIAAGRPDMTLPAWGSFEGWTALVRNAIVWIGLPDPGETRVALQNSADSVAESFGVIIECWEKMDPQRQGMTTAQVIDTLKPKGKTSAGNVASTSSVPPWHDDMRDAVEGLIGRLDARLLGNKLRSFRRRVFGQRYFDRAGTAQRAVRWAVCPVSTFGGNGQDTHLTHQTHLNRSECGECGEFSSPDAGFPRGDAWEGDGDTESPPT
jgi:hypothetical protein